LGIGHEDYVVAWKRLNGQRGLSAADGNREDGSEND
jgi:hypothetical protein